METLATRGQRRLIIFLSVTVVLAALSLWLAVSLRAYLVPLAVGLFTAYACLPILNRLRRLGVPGALAKLGLFAVFVMAWLAIFIQVQSLLANPEALPHFQDRLRAELNATYQRAFGAGGWMEGESRIGRYVHEKLDGELRPLLNRASALLLASQEQGAAGASSPADSVGQSHEDQQSTAGETGLARVGQLLALWIVTPVLFLFVMYDETLPKRAVLRIIPNRFFMPALNVMNEIQIAFSGYLKGMLKQVALVSATLLLLFGLAGIPLKVALMLALAAGIANIIPFFGPLVGLGLGLVYALVATEVHPLLPFVTLGNLPLWILIGVGITQLLDNTVYQPFVVGNSVALHPLVVIMGLLAGSYLFGIVGLLFAVPAIVLIKVFATSVFNQLTVFRLI